MRASAPPSAAEYGLGQMRTTGSAVPAAMTPPQKGVFHAPRVMSAAARAASRFAWGTRSSAKTTSPWPRSAAAPVGEGTPRAPARPGRGVRPAEDVVEALGALGAEQEEGRGGEGEGGRGGGRGDAERGDRGGAPAEHRDRRDQERAGGDR